MSSQADFRVEETAYASVQQYLQLVACMPKDAPAFHRFIGDAFDDSDYGLQEDILMVSENASKLREETLQNLATAMKEVIALTATMQPFVVELQQHCQALITDPDAKAPDGSHLLDKAAKLSDDLLKQVDGFKSKYRTATSRIEESSKLLENVENPLTKAKTKSEDIWRREYGDDHNSSRRCMVELRDTWGREQSMRDASHLELTAANGWQAAGAAIRDICSNWRYYVSKSRQAIFWSKWLPEAQNRLVGMRQGLKTLGSINGTSQTQLGDFSQMLSECLGYLTADDEHRRHQALENINDAVALYDQLSRHVADTSELPRTALQHIDAFQLDTDTYLPLGLKVKYLVHAEIFGAVPHLSFWGPCFMDWDEITVDASELTLFRDKRQGFDHTFATYALVLRHETRYRFFTCAESSGRHHLKPGPIEDSRDDKCVFSDLPPAIDPPSDSSIRILAVHWDLHDIRDVDVWRSLYEIGRSKANRGPNFFIWGDEFFKSSHGHLEWQKRKSGAIFYQKLEPQDTSDKDRVFVLSADWDVGQFNLGI